MFLFTCTAAILSIIVLSFAAFIIAKQGRDLLARYLGYYLLAVGTWIGANSLADIAATPASLIFWSGVALIGVSFFISFHLAFIYVFIHQRDLNWRRAVSYFLPSVIVSLGAFSRYSVMETIFPPGQPAQIVPGLLYTIVFLFFLVGGVLYAAVRLALYYRRQATPVERMQILYMEMGFMLLFAGTIIFDYALPLFGELRFYSIGPQFAVFLMVCSGYAILKHRLLDIKVVIQRSVVFSLLLGVISALYVGVLFVILALSAPYDGRAYLFASIITTFVAIFGLPPIKRTFEKATDHVFFKNRYVYTEAVETISRVLNENLDLNDLLFGMSGALKNIFRVSDVAITVLDNPIPCAETLTPMEPEECQRALGTCPIGCRDRLVLILPVILKNQVIALIGLGNKRSGDPYFSDDTVLLTSFSYQAAVSIEKAKLYGQMKDHSEHLEEKIRERTAEIKALQETQAQMMYDISHSLQTPLTIIKGQLGAIKRNVPGEELRSFEESLDRISEFINRLLRLASLNDSEKPQKRPVNFSRLLEDIVEYFRVLAEQQNISIESNIAPGAMIMGDRGQIEEMVLNILSNASKYIAHERKIVIAAAVRDGRAVLSISDTGVGIPLDDIPKIFRRFYRAPSPSGTKGSGLGLSICKKIIDLHDGTIDIKSWPDKGTTVTIALPLMPASEQAAQKAEPPPAADNGLGA